MRQCAGIAPSSGRFSLSLGVIADENRSSVRCRSEEGGQTSPASSHRRGHCAETLLLAHGADPYADE
jgi:hypothetical protein